MQLPNESWMITIRLLCKVLGEINDSELTGISHS